MRTRLWPRPACHPAGTARRGQRGNRGGAGRRGPGPGPSCDPPTCNGRRGRGGERSGAGGRRRVRSHTHTPAAIPAAGCSGRKVGGSPGSAAVFEAGILKRGWRRGGRRLQTSGAPRHCSLGKWVVGRWRRAYPAPRRLRAPSGGVRERGTAGRVGGRSLGWESRSRQKRAVLCSQPRTSFNAVSRSRISRPTMAEEVRSSHVGTFLSPFSKVAGVCSLLPMWWVNLPL